ncbi:ATP-binding cassette domain-containing protein [Agromyces bauzanensis]
MDVDARVRTDPAGALLSLHDVEVRYPGATEASAQDISFDVRSGRTLGLVGESGSGKSTIGRAVLGLVPISAGSMSYRGEDISHRDQRVSRRLSAHLQVVFQDPYSSLNPNRTIEQTLVEPLLVHSALGSREMRDAAAEMLAEVGLDEAALGRYPAHFSGGQRQRIAIARALIVGPELVICDEAVSALDLSVQAQVLNLLKRLQADRDVTYLFISHDLDVVRFMAHEMVVLRRGEIVEHGAAEQLISAPKHPYTRRLLASAPVPDIERQHRRREAARSFAED